MREIKYTSQFKRDYKRENKSGSHKNVLDRDLLRLVKLLASNKALPRKYCDHSLGGNWKDYRDCHIKPDLILIYRKTDDNFLELVRLGSHAKLGL